MAWYTQSMRSWWRYHPGYDPRKVPAIVDIETTLWLEWFDNADGYWDEDAAQWRQT